MISWILKNWYYEIVSHFVCLFEQALKSISTFSMNLHGFNDTVWGLNHQVCHTQTFIVEITCSYCCTIIQITLLTADILSGKNVRAWVSMDFTLDKYSAPRILIFSIAMGAVYSFYMKTIETHARVFLPLNISAISSV